MIFLKAIISIPHFVDDRVEIEAYHIGNLNSPAVQHLLSEIEEGDYLRIKGIGLLLIRGANYISGNILELRCRKVNDNGIRRAKEL